MLWKYKSLFFYIRLFPYPYNSKNKCQQSINPQKDSAPRLANRDNSNNQRDNEDSNKRYPNNHIFHLIYCLFLDFKAKWSIKLITLQSLGSSSTCGMMSFNKSILFWYSLRHCSFSMAGFATKTYSLLSGFCRFLRSNE